MNYEIRIKGRNETLMVDEKIGSQIKRDWEDYCMTKRDAVVEIGTWFGKLSDIRDFTGVAANRSDTKTHEKTQAEYHKEVLKIRALSPDLRAQRLGMFKLMYFTYTGKSPDEETMKKATEIQQKFFTENPRRTVCNPFLFRELIAPEDYRDTSTAKEGMRKPGFVMGGIGIIENVVRQDKFAAKYL